jgi:DNA-binding SARP family transcriptional activator
MAYPLEFVHPPIDSDSLPVRICLLGGFRLLKCGTPVRIRGDKVAALLSSLALRRGYAASRDLLLQTLWPDSEPSLAAQSLHTLVYSLHRELGDAIGGAAPVIYVDRAYRLNVVAGMGVDVAEFERYVAVAERLAQAHRRHESADAYTTAVRLYRGDLSVDTDLHAVLERERLRGLYLTALSRLADHHYQDGDYQGALNWALAILVNDPCREDAHRLAMRCYLRRGERAQALRQYQLCERILRKEFDAIPEPATTSLFDQIRLDPESLQRL